MVNVAMSPSNRSSSTAWFVRVVIAVVCLWVVSLVLGPRTISSVNNLSSLPIESIRITPLKYKAEIFQDHSFHYMIPASPKGILIFFHGCQHSGEDMFELPEDRVVAYLALSRDLAVLSLTSHNRESGCWSKHVDLTALQKSHAIDKWIESKGLDPNLPRIGMGASSGGAMVVIASKALELRAVASYIMAKPYENMKDAVPTVFVHMSRDATTAGRVKQQVKALQEASVPVLELSVKPHAFTKELCDQRIPELGKQKCKLLLQAAHSNADGKLLRETGVVLQSYTTGHWDYVLDDVMRLNDILEKQEQPNTDMRGNSRLRAAVEEEIAVAYGMHEMTAEHASQVLDFLMKHAGIQ